MCTLLRLSYPTYQSPALAAPSYQLPPVSNTNGKHSLSTLLRSSFRNAAVRTIKTVGCTEDTPLLQALLKGTWKIHSSVTVHSIYCKRPPSKAWEGGLPSNAAFHKLHSTLLVCLFKTQALQFAIKRFTAISRSVDEDQDRRSLVSGKTMYWKELNCRC